MVNLAFFIICLHLFYGFWERSSAVLLLLGLCVYVCYKSVRHSDKSARRLPFHDLYDVFMNIVIMYVKTIEKHLEMPYWNLLYLRRINLLVYYCSVSKNKITKPYAKTFDGLLVNDV